MERLDKKFGFGCMRLPMKEDDTVDYEHFSKMIDFFITNGFCYFDTAHGYVSGQSEFALKQCLTSKYPREQYVLANKLTNHFFQTQEDIRPFFQNQLLACGVDYFDYYLMHAQSTDIYEKFKRCSAYQTAAQLKKEGKIKYLGISFHDKADVLERILQENPEVEFVQIQFNYLDYEDPVVESRKCYEICMKYDKPVIVMEPCRGGNLVNLPQDADAILNELNGGSNASYAIRYAASFEHVFMVLSGMSNMEQMEDNVSYMKDFKPLNNKEMEAVEKVCEIIQSKNLISCTDCKYCVDGCPKHILIPNLFSCYNSKKIFNSWNTDYYYQNVHTVKNGKASECIKCKKCEKICPQHLNISSLMEDVAKEFEQ